MIEPAKYEGGGDEGVEPDAACTMCALCDACLPCYLCGVCTCGDACWISVAEPLGDITKASWANAIWLLWF